MIVTFITDHPCPQCGHHNHRTAIANIRIQRTDYRTLWPTIGAAPTSCQECGGPLADHPDQHDVHPDDATHIDNWRTRRGWAAA